MPWFNRGGARPFNKHVLPLAGQKLHYLEIGVFDGDGLVWMLKNVLTHPRSRAWAVDPWLPLLPWRDAEEMEGHYQRTWRACRPYGKKVKLHRQMSSVFLRQHNIPPHWFDVVYIDGDHNAIPCLDDLVLTWPLLKVGGIMIIDDYKLNHPADYMVKAVVDGVMDAIYGPYVEELFHGYQVAYRKTGDVELTASPDDDSPYYVGIQTRRANTD
jgi:hypothetical protein